MFLAVVGFSALAAAVLPCRNFALALLACVAGACRGLGVLTVSWCGFVLLGLMALAVGSILRTMAQWPQPGSATAALMTRALVRLALFAVLFQLAVPA
jgi:hypothetical protein